MSFSFYFTEVEVNANKRKKTSIATFDVAVIYVSYGRVIDVGDFAKAFSNTTDWWWCSQANKLQVQCIYYKGYRQPG